MILCISYHKNSKWSSLCAIQILAFNQAFHHCIDISTLSQVFSFYNLKVNLPAKLSNCNAWVNTRSFFQYFESMFLDDFFRFLEWSPSLWNSKGTCSFICGMISVRAFDEFCCCVCIVPSVELIEDSTVNEIFCRSKNVVDFKAYLQRIFPRICNENETWKIIIQYNVVVTICRVRSVVCSE